MLGDDRQQGTNPQFSGLLDDQVHFVALDQGLGHRKKGGGFLILVAGQNRGLDRGLFDCSDLCLVGCAVPVKKGDDVAWLQSEDHADVAGLLIGNYAAFFGDVCGINKESSHGLWAPDGGGFAVIVQDFQKAKRSIPPGTEFG